SYHAILGRAVAGMGIAMVPRLVLNTFPDLKLLSVHPLPADFHIARTVFIRRKGAVSPKVSALIEVLLERADIKARPGAGRKGRGNGAALAASSGARARRPRPAQIV